MSQVDTLADEIGEAYRRWRLPLELPQAERFGRYLDLLERWNDAVSLTSIRDRQAAILRHFVEPGMALNLLTGAGPVLVDVGSGAGFPGLPLKILDPDRHCILVEANGRKAAFLREVIDTLELDDVEVLEGRFEEHILEGRLAAPIHVLTARAWSAWAELLGITAGLMAPGGRAVLFVGDETLRAVKRHLMGSPSEASLADPEWGPAVHADWQLRRISSLPHLDRGALVSLELPAD